MTEEWFSELKRAYSRLPNYEAAYALLEQLYFRLLDECTCDSGILLVGFFAKTDFLLKEKPGFLRIWHGHHCDRDLSLPKRLVMSERIV